MTIDQYEVGKLGRLCGMSQLRVGKLLGAQWVLKSSLVGRGFQYFFSCAAMTAVWGLTSEGRGSCEGLSRSGLGPLILSPLAIFFLPSRIHSRMFGCHFATIKVACHESFEKRRVIGIGYSAMA